MAEFNFSNQGASLSDDEFWNQIRELDELAQELPDVAGFQIKAKLATGKEVTIPFVRFTTAIPKKKS